MNSFNTLSSKQKGTSCFSVDHRKPNARIMFDIFSIPQMNQCSDTLREASILRAQDANSEHRIMEIDETDQYKTDFLSHQRLFRFFDMSLKLRNAPGTFKSVLDVMLYSEK